MHPVLQDFVLAVAAFGSAYLLARWLSPKPATPSVDLPIGTLVRLVTTGGAYRCRVSRCGPDGIDVSAPLHHDRFVPLRPGQTVIVQVPEPGGLLTFRTEIVQRDSESHVLHMSRPSALRRTDRRTEPRLTTVEGDLALVDSVEARMVDLSASGARVVTFADPRAGDRVRLDLKAHGACAFGWVLASEAAQLRGRPARELRIRFEEPLDGIAPRVFRLAR